MAVTLTIKQVPDDLVARLRAIAASNHRSLQGELMHTIEARVAATEVRYEDARPAPPEVRYEEPSAVPRWQLNDDTIHASARRYREAARQAGQGKRLLVKLDALVADSHFGEAPPLSREQVYDRAFARAMMQSDEK